MCSTIVILAAFLAISVAGKDGKSPLVPNEVNLDLNKTEVVTSSSLLHEPLGQNNRYSNPSPNSDLPYPNTYDHKSNTYSNKLVPLSPQRPANVGYSVHDEALDNFGRPRTRYNGGRNLKKPSYSYSSINGVTSTLPTRSQPHRGSNNSQRQTTGNKPTSWNNYNG